MYKIIISLALFETISFAVCPACVCTETVSPIKSQEYQLEIERTIQQKINPKIEEISKKSNKAKELQKQINEMLEQYKKMEIQTFVLNKQKNFYLENITKEASLGEDMSILENRVISERIKSKIELMSSYQSKDLEKDIEEFIK